MPTIINGLLQSRGFELFARVLLTLPFWASGFAKAFDFAGGMADMQRFGLEPAWLFNVLTILVQLGGSALIIANRWTWLAAGALGVFTFLTIFIAHHFWALEGVRGVVAMHTAAEHMGMIGALMLVSILSVRPRAAAAAPDHAGSGAVSFGR